jgi:CRISPR-associated endonuclease/helicase Cas3
VQINLQFWAKTPASTADWTAEKLLPAGYKPVLHHLLDVAAVAKTFLLRNPARLRREAALLGIADEGYVNLAAFLAGLHDLGKFSRPFQAKRIDLWPVVLGPPPAGTIEGVNHWRATAILLRTASLNARFRSIFPALASGYEMQIVDAVAGHHGMPPPMDDARISAHGLRVLIDEPCLAAAGEAYEWLARMTELSPVPGMNEDLAATYSWRLSGLTTLADWVGSDADFFDMVDPAMPIDEYWRLAQLRAEQALAGKGLLAPKPIAAPSLLQIAPRASAAPRPSQSLAQSLGLADGPQLIVIEDATGSGKTEAAILLAARLLSEGRAEGLYIALPTMATANAMHQRLASVVNRLFEESGEGRARPSLILAHGRAALAGAIAGLDARPLGDGESSTARVCNDWIADDRRRAFFADVGAGTIDQAFLAVLPKKHLALRQYALAGKILIVDEAHCFDAYMKEELGALLHLHAMNGGSSIVLSATLSRHARRAMAAAFLRGRGLTSTQARRAAGACVSSAYPLVTQITSGGITEIAPGFAEGLRRSIEVVRLEGRADAAQAAVEAADHGAAVLIICNAVDESIAVHVAVAAARPPGTVHLFHARFAHGDRLTAEANVLGRFGRDGALSERAGHILVATQVVEQSLDLDFDLVISDLAPVDLLIQRAGRLWRHTDLRPPLARPVPGPRLMVVSPDPASVETAGWLVSCLGKAANIYDHAGIMWRSARTIFAKTWMKTPDDLRQLIEAVYGDEVEAVPPALTAGERIGARKQSAAKTLGAFNVVDLEAGYASISGVSADEDIGTRLGEPTLTVRLARRRSGKLRPWFESGSSSRHVDWALSEVKVRRAFWGDAAPPPEDHDLHQEARSDWTEWDAAMALAEVAADGVLRFQGGAFSYDRTAGLKKL